MFEMETTQQMIKHLRFAQSELSLFTIAMLVGVAPIGLFFDHYKIAKFSVRGPVCNTGVGNIPPICICRDLEMAPHVLVDGKTVEIWPHNR